MDKPSAAIIAGTLLAFSLSGCATFTPPIIGASIGGVVGGVSGAAIGSPDHPVGGAMIGAASGAAIGALIGYLVTPKKKTDIPVATLGNTEPGTPPMLSPKVQRVWIPDRISDDGRKFEKGHYSYEIERNAVWTMP